MVKKSNVANSFSILGLDISGINKEEFIRRIIYLTIIALCTKFAILLFSPIIPGSFIDLFDIGLYLQYAVNTAQGSIPYIDFNIEYPPLFLIPILAPIPFALMTNNAMTYVYTYQVIMTLFDILTLYCVYLIGLKIYDAKKAFTAGILYATAFSATYFVLTKYDAFPTFLLMLAITFTVYNKQTLGYLSGILGFFTKIFPAIALPYMILYNSRDSSLKEQIVKIIICALPCVILLFIPLFLINPHTISAYLSATGSTFGIYVNTATYTLYSLFQAIGISVPINVISLIMYAIMIVIVLLFLVNAFVHKIDTPRKLLIYILVTLITLIVCSKFHSPQYIVWITPFFALLLADLIHGIYIHYIIQISGFLEFPILFNTYYTNLEYSSAVGTSEWYTIVLFFTAEILIWVISAAYILKSEAGLIDEMKTLPSALRAYFKKQT